MTTPISIPPALLNRATAGDLDAQFELAQLYMESEHDDDIERAEEWGLKAASLGHIEAMYWLGEGYTVYAKDLLEVDPDEAKTYFEHAHHWLHQAAAQKHAAAILELAGFYRRGDVVEKDIAKSIALLEQSAELGEAQAMRDLSAIYAHGLGVEIDEEKADQWMLKANQFS